MEDLDQSGQQLSETLHRTMTAVHPELTSLVVGAAAQGRALRRRRRAGIAASVAAVAALGVGGGLLLVPGAASTSAAAGATESPKAATTVATTGQTHGTPLTGQAALLALYDALPAGTPRLLAQGSQLVLPAGNGRQVAVLSSATLAGADASSAPAYTETVNVSLRTGYGPGHDQGTTNPWTGTRFSLKQPLDTLLGCTHPAPGNYRACTTSTLPDGSRLRLSEDVTDYGMTTRDVWLLRADGTLVVASADRLQYTNGPGSPSPTPSPTPPTVTLDQLKAAATSPELQASVPEEFAAKARRTITSYLDGGTTAGALPQVGRN
ncbi:hypothetical protein ABT095_20295 [Kitasatospora sp. NPDC002227]|uniref:hypothetical protein n=1 Tax=Kitasatospora sp. NPDC002227 TaxID=3154773 RepID=UPI003318CDF1